MNKSILSLFITVFVGFAPISAKSKKQSTSIRREVTVANGQVSLKVQKLERSKDLLTSKKLTKRYAPLLVTFTNDSETSYFLRQENFGMPVAPLRELKNHFRPSYWGSQIKGKLIGSAVAIGAAVVTDGLTRSRDAGVIAGRVVGTGASIYAQGKKHDKSFKRNLNRHETLEDCVTDLREPLQINPKSTVQKIVYVPHSSYQSSFSIKLSKHNSSDALHFNAAMAMVV